MQRRQAQLENHAHGQAEVNPAWVSFFAEAIRLGELARQRRAAREAAAINETGEATNENGEVTNGTGSNSEALAPQQAKT